MAGFVDALTTSVTNEPPSPADQRRNDWAMIGLILFALFLAWGVRNNNLNATQELTVDPALPALPVPAGWIQSAPGEEFLLRAVDPDSPSSFDARLEVSTRPLRQDETLDLISISRPLEQTQRLDRFRSLSSAVVELADGEPGLLLTFAYVADPTRDRGALGLPVVVKGQELLFVQAADGEQRLVVVSMAADATEWPEQREAFTGILAALGAEDN